MPLVASQEKSTQDKKSVLPAYLLYTKGVTTERKSSTLATIHKKNKKIAVKLVKKDGVRAASQPASLPVAAAAKQADDLCCPLTHVRFEQPVVAEDGHTYERSAIADWVASRGTSPSTGAAMGPSFFPNIAMVSLLQRLGPHGQLVYPGSG